MRSPWCVYLGAVLGGWQGELDGWRIVGRHDGSYHGCWWLNQNGDEESYRVGKNQLREASNEKAGCTCVTAG
jgi:hypothetical protein